MLQGPRVRCRLTSGDDAHLLGALLEGSRSITTRFLSAIPQFTVPDLVRTTAYYRDVLGFRIEGYWDGEQVTTEPSGESVFAIVSRDEVQLFFSRDPEKAVRSGRTRGANDVYVRVTDVDALAKELRARGSHLRGEPEDQVYGQREIVIEDCNGLVLTFAEELDRTGA